MPQLAVISPPQPPPQDETQPKVSEVNELWKLGSTPWAWGLGFGRGFGTAQLCYKRGSVCGVGWEVKLTSSDSSPQLPFCTQGYKMKDGGATQVWEPYSSSLPTLIHNCSSNSDLEYLIKSCASFEKTLTSLHICKLLIHQSPPFQTSSGKYQPQIPQPLQMNLGKVLGSQRLHFKL